MAGEKIVSTVAFKSNLQIVTEQSISEDRSFLSCVRDPFGLKIMREKMMCLTAIQEKEYDNASLHCIYAPEDDYPFGTIIDAGGRECVVCRCTNTRCPLFSRCRPDFDPAELDAVSSNALFRAAAAEMVACAHRQGNTGRDTGNERAAGILYAGRGEDEQRENTGFPETAAAEAVPTGARGEQAPVSGGRDNADVSTETDADATFESFRTVEQADIIRLAPEERAIVNAGPGTGKTWTLIEKIKYMLNELGTGPEEILVLCFSRAAVEVVRSRLQAAAGNNELPLDWHQVDVRSFDSFATYMLAWLLEDRPEALPENYALEARSYDERIADAAEALKNVEGILDSYRHVIVDEVQDLVGVRAEMVLALLGILPADCGFTLLGDSCQALYDYLAAADERIMPSELFYRTLFHLYPRAEYCSLERNYRQGDELGKTTLPYREAILTGTPESRSREASSLDSLILTADVNPKHFTADAARKYTDSGTLGILTRSNGQALQISSWLRTEGIEHNLERPAGASGLGAWLAAVFREAETDVIAFPEFKTIFGRLYPGTDAGLFWDAVLSAQTDTSRRHYEIEALLRGLLLDARNPLLFDEPCGRNALITVSNVHRAKGREYDTVLVLEDIVKDMCHAAAENQQEHRVCYVALTRPKKKIEKLKLDTQYIYISKDEERRCFRAGGRFGRKYLSHYEVGFDTDLDPRSFAASGEIQRYLREALGRDTRLKLLKCPENTGEYTVYRIVPEEAPDMVLGYTTRKFARGMERAIQTIFGNPRPVAYRYFPGIFRDLYVDGLTSCVSARGQNIPGAIRFGKMYIWNGVRVSGFAQMEKDRY